MENKSSTKRMKNEIESIIYSNAKLLIEDSLEDYGARFIIENIGFFGKAVHLELRGERLREEALKAVGAQSWAVQSVVNTFSQEDCGTLALAKLIEIVLDRNGVEIVDVYSNECLKAFARLIGSDIEFDPDGMFRFSWWESDIGEAA